MTLIFYQTEWNIYFVLNKARDSECLNNKKKLKGKYKKKPSGKEGMQYITMNLSRKIKKGVAETKRKNKM